MMIVVPQKDKEEQGFIDHELDEDTGYRSPALPNIGGRVLLD